MGFENEELKNNSRVKPRIDDPELEVGIISSSTGAVRWDGSREKVGRRETELIGFAWISEVDRWILEEFGAFGLATRGFKASPRKVRSWDRRLYDLKLNRLVAMGVMLEWLDAETDRDKYGVLKGEPRVRKDFESIVRLINLGFQIPVIETINSEPLDCRRSNLTVFRTTLGLMPWLRTIDLRMTQIPRSLRPRPATPSVIPSRAPGPSRFGPIKDPGGHSGSPNDTWHTS